MDLISVIVPIYKVEQYLDRCVESLIHQTYQNLEIILVDDGSPDQCPAMCDAWAKKDSRIKVIHKKNGGLSDARNAGMEIASGQYMGFVDSDDWVEPDMYRFLYQHMQDTTSDIVSGGVRYVWENGFPSRTMTYSGEPLTFTRQEAMASLINETALVVPVWNKLYSREVIGYIRFPVGKINEDEFWSWQIIARANRISSVPDVFYNYLQRGGSIMSQQLLKQPLHAIEAKCQRHEYIVHHIPELTDLSCMNLMYICLYRAQVLRRTQPKSEIQKYLCQLKKVVKQHRPNRDYVKNLSVKQKIRFFMIQHCFDLTCWVQNLLHIGI